MRYVVDSGVVKAKAQLNGGLAALRTVAVSKAQAEQRRGRAGREVELFFHIIIFPFLLYHFSLYQLLTIIFDAQKQAPGWCYRLYPEDVYDQFAPTAIPEV